MKTNIVHMNRVMKRGDKFVVASVKHAIEFVVLAVELRPVNMVNTYWVAQVLEKK